MENKNLVWSIGMSAVVNRVNSLLINEFGGRRSSAPLLIIYRPIHWSLTVKPLLRTVLKWGQYGGQKLYDIIGTKHFMKPWIDIEYVDKWFLNFWKQLFDLLCCWWISRYLVVFSSILNIVHFYGKIRVINDLFIPCFLLKNFRWTKIKHPFYRSLFVGFFYVSVFAVLHYIIFKTWNQVNIYYIKNL